MFHSKLIITAPFVLAMVLWSCSSTKEETVPQPEVKKETPPAVVMEPEKIYRYDQRYLVQDASIDKATKVTDPLQAVRVIQIKPGENQVLVISSFDHVNEDGKDVALETWLGIEMPSFAAGTYNLASAVQTSFYRFYLGESGKRFDGKSIDGTITVEKLDKNYLTGTIEAVIQGTSKSFEGAETEFRYSMSGPFRIRVVPIEATIMRDRR
jgi:hypothetical protein